MRQETVIQKFINNRQCPERSVHYGKTKRFDVAKTQHSMTPVDLDKIITWTNEFIQLYGLALYSGSNLVYTAEITLNDFNHSTLITYEEITSKADIIWMKFTTDHYLGVVACSNDINFDIPPNNTSYDVPRRLIHGKVTKWKYNSSGILIHSLGLNWDQSFVLVFPLIGLAPGKEGTKQRHEIENGVGNYLLSKNVPIIDFYSHRI